MLRIASGVVEVSAILVDKCRHTTVKSSKYSHHIRTEASKALPVQEVENGSSPESMFRDSRLAQPEEGKKMELLLLSCRSSLDSS